MSANQSVRDISLGPQNPGLGLVTGKGAYVGLKSAFLMNTPTQSYATPIGYLQVPVPWPPPNPTEIRLESHEYLIVIFYNIL